MGIVAIIPARGGSKGIPRKNVIDFCGSPLIAWTIACARKSTRIEKVYVSTDDAEISRTAELYGAAVIDRPAEISGDRSSSEAALIHACEVIGKHTGMPDAIVFLQATSPLRETSELDGALKRFEDENLDSLFSAAQPEDMLLWMQEGDVLQSLNYDHLTRKRRQDMDHQKQVWIETGSFYITRTSLLLRNQNRLGGRIGLWPVPFWKSFEIDSVETLGICSSLMREYGLDSSVPEPKEPHIGC
jgi:CMP-N,N'-diacetyllegionaminic acid synthase